MASEVGVLDIPPERILQKGRSSPDACSSSTPKQGRIIDDEEIKEDLLCERPYRGGSTSTWSTSSLTSPTPRSCPEPDHETLSSARSPSATPTRTSASS
jgi:hypothetical protein